MTAASILQGADFAHQFLSKPEHRSNSVWFVVQHGFTAPDLYDVEQIMDDTRLDVERADFPAMENLTLYRFQNPKTPDPEAVTVREALKRRAEPQDFEAAMASVGVRRDAGTWVENLVAFEYAFDLRALAPPKNPHELGQILLSLLATSVEVAYPLAQHAVARYPENGSCQLALGLACMERGEVEDARRAFGRCDGLADILAARHPLLGLTQAMAAGDCARMADALEAIRKLGNLEIGRLAWDRPSLLRECVEHACPQTAGASRP
jgi:hypothetical protein